MFCQECGEENRNDRKFCANCGAPLRDYTKPRENLVMPDDVNNTHIKNLKIKKTNLIFNIILGILLLIGILFLIVTFFTVDNLQLTFSIISLSSLILYIIISITKMVYNKKHKIEE